ncbi:DUF3021 domain-containing protein [Christensenella timonensis]|uniref:DUF3021 domain-containing protein n=1 Tax=Christensenella timonensis TaxID=1816678 RepID=UPI00138FC5AB|nr:DUF3021 domain-containing protein [Christensenella timonensis]
MKKEGIKRPLYLFYTVFSSALLVALLISTCITLVLGYDALPLSELRNDVIFGLFIGLVQLIWVGSDRNNKTYLIRTILHFVVLLTGCTLLMVWFGWLPPSEWLAFYYIGFIAAYVLIWAICYQVNKKHWRKMNEKLEAYKKANRD